MAKSALMMPFHVINPFNSPPTGKWLASKIILCGWVFYFVMCVAKESAKSSFD